MALITLPVGNVLVPWTGPATTLAGQPWFTSTNLAAVYRVSTNRQSYVSSIPNDPYGFPQVVPTAAGQGPDAYIFVVKTAFQLDSALIGQPVAVPNAVRLVAHFAAGQTNLAFPLKITSTEQVGTYIVDSGNPALGVTISSYSIGGTAVSLPTPILNVGDTLTIVGSTQTVGEGYLTLIKQ